MGKVTEKRRKHGFLQPPTPLDSTHRTDRFDCGEESLNDWLRKRALKNQVTGGSRTFVVCEPDHRVVGYYALAAGSVVHRAAPGKIRRNMPDPIPVVVLGRLAVDLSWPGRGLGGDLLSNAVKRSIQTASHVGVRALIVHALSEEAKRFYERSGFQSSPTDPIDLVISLKEAAASLLKG